MVVEDAVGHYLNLRIKSERNVENIRVEMYSKN